MKNKIICPVCGSDNLASETVTQQYSLPFSAQYSYDEKNDQCLDCEAEGDFSEHGESPKYLEVIEGAKQESILNMIHLLHENGYTMSALERAFELPFRTLTQWKQKKNCSAAGLALMRILATYPWVVEVAERRFESNFSEDILVKQAVNTFNNKAARNDYYPKDIKCSDLKQELSITATYGHAKTISDPCDAIFINQNSSAA